MNLEKHSFNREQKETKDDWRSFAEKLSKVWKKRVPEIENTTTAEVEADEEFFEARENAVNDLEIKEVLARYGFDVADLSIYDEFEIDSHLEPIYRLAVRNHFTKDRLPAGYGYTGGAARSLLMRSIGVDPDYIPRDLDVARLAVEEPYRGADADISQRLMPEDTEFKHGVRDESDRFRYFNNRDLTINQVLATDEEIFVSRQCLLDTARHILRPTEFEKNRFSDLGLEIGPKLLAKILRFYAENIRCYDEAAMEDFADMTLEKAFVVPFYFALQLDKAAEISYQSAQDYVDILISKKRLPEDIKTVEEAAEFFLLAVYNFNYRHAPTKQIEIEQDWVEQYGNVMKIKSREKIKKSKE